MLVRHIVLRSGLLELRAGSSSPYVPAWPREVGLGSCNETRAANIGLELPHGGGECAVGFVRAELAAARSATIEAFEAEEDWALCAVLIGFRVGCSGLAHISIELTSRSALGCSIVGAVYRILLQLRKVYDSTWYASIVYITRFVNYS